MRHLDRARRFIGTALLWFLFGLTGLFAGILVFPLLTLFVRDTKKRQFIARKIIGLFFGWFCSSGCAMGVFAIDIRGLEHYDENRSLLILANHPTLIDVVILISLFPQVDCVVKEAVVRNPFMRGLVGPANYISNCEPADLLESCVAHLRAGDSLLLFPEGTRTERGQPPALKLGAAEIAVRAQADVLPIVIDCRPQFLTKTDPWYWIPEKQPRFRIELLSPMAAEALISRQSDNQPDRYRLNESLSEIFSSCSVGV